MTRDRNGADAFQQLFLQSAVPQAVIDLAGRITAVNAATCALFDRTPEELIGQALLDRVPEVGRAADADLLAAVVRGEVEASQFERRLDHRDGRTLDTLVSVSAVRSPAGEISEISVCLQDITELKTAQLAAERAQARWRSLSQNASDIALVVDPALCLDYVSPSVVELLGEDHQAVVGTSLLTLVHPEDASRVSAAMHRLIVEPQRQLTHAYRIRSRARGWRYVEQRVINLLADPDVEGLVVNLRDVTEQVELQATVQRSVVQDALTGLPNRILLLDRIEQAIERAQGGGPPYALLFVDMDRLKAINETFDHALGDRILKTVADTLCALVRPTDTVARCAGDEFAVLLEDADGTGEAEATAARIAAALNTGIDCPGLPPVRFSACVGLAHGPAPSAEALLSAAEAATSQAKATGRGRVHVLETLARDRAVEHRALGRDLTAAVAQDELVLHFQPIVELASGRITGFEALVRWLHPERGLLVPGDFLPLAEALDLQIGIDEWVLQTACEIARDWPAGTDGPVTVAVNVAPAHLVSAGFADSVRAALTRSGLPPAALVLEVTETAVVTDLALAEEVLRALTDLGVCISIDDFGTGYSSMLQLRQLPFDKLKIDREFVRRLPHNRDDVAICASVISLAKRLDVRSIAEGIETTEQAAALAALGCGYGQGFLWSPAVPPGDVAALLEREPWRVDEALGLDVPVGARRPEDEEVAAMVTSLHMSGASLHTIAAGLNRDGHRTANGRRWHPATVARLLYRAGG